MEKTLYIIAMTMLLAASCQKIELTENANNERAEYNKTLTVRTEKVSLSRVGFDAENSFYWTEGDRIGVFTSEGIEEMTLSDGGQRQRTGTFYGNFQAEIGKYAVYPFGNHSLANGQLTFYLPTSYNYTSIAADANSFNPPMLGKITEGIAELKHLASFIRVTVTNIPAGGDDMQFILTADQRITGDFIADISLDVPTIVTDDSAGNSVTIFFSNDTAGTTGTFYIPVPLGTYQTVKVQILDGSTVLASKAWSDVAVQRMTPKKGEMEVNFIAKINNTLYGSLQEAIEAATNHTIILGQDFVLDDPIEIAQGKVATLDLNGHTLSKVATSPSPSYLTTIKSGGNLTIKNGTVTFAATTPDTQWGGEGQPPYPGYANNTISNQGTLIIENATIENKTSKGGASYVIDNYAGANLIINEGAVLKQSGGDIAIRMFNGGSGAINVTINGGEISGYRAVWVQLASNNPSIAPIMNLTINGGTLTSTDQTYNQAIYSYSYGNDMQNVLINVNGGTFNGDIGLTGGANKTNLETLNISGGTFNGSGGFYSYGEYTKALDAIKVSGGTFMINTSDYLEAGYTIVETDGRWTVIAGE